MAHVQERYSRLWYPRDPTVDKISSQKMFIDNIHAMEAFALSIMQNVHQSVQTLDDLKAIDTSDATLFKTGMLVMVHEYGLYSFNRSSTADESYAVVAPTVGSGRWITTQVTDIALSPRQVNTNADLDALMTSMITQMSNNSTKFLMVRGLGGTEPPLYGGAAHIIMNKSDNLYATATMILYNHDRIALYYTRTRYDGIWGRWVTLPYLDANGKIPVSQLPVTYVANATVIDEVEVVNGEVD